MIFPLWIVVLTILTSNSLTIAEDNILTEQPVTLTLGVGKTPAQEDVSTTPSIEQEHESEEILSTNSNNVEEDVSTTPNIEKEYGSEEILSTNSNNVEEHINTTPSIKRNFGTEEILLNKINSVEIDENSSNGKYIEEVLEAQNKYRMIHGVPPLQLRKELNEKSQAWANHLAETNKIENSFSDYAENIYVENIYAERNGTAAVKYWYDKIKFYTPGKLTYDWWNAASFTQLIWAKSKYLGVGIAENDQFRFVVCFYDPPGNIIGQDPLGMEDDYPPLPPEKTFYVLPGGVFREGNENENLTDTVLEKIIEEVLEAHNQYRALHGVPPLQIQDELSKESQAWADQLADTNTFHHSTSIHGENIYEEPVYFDRNGTSPVKVWYDEIEFYKFGKEPEDWSKVGHFTQLIWSETKYVGIGLSENENTRFIVCNYDPRGNIINQSHYEKFIPPIEYENILVEESPVTELNIQEDKNATRANLEEFRQEILDAHNKLRALHGVNPLQLKDELNLISQDWAEHLAAINAFEHRSSNYGENIYFSTNNIEPNATLLVKYWYDEIRFYKFGKEPEDWSKVVHFTQLIWSQSKYLGVGLAQNEDMRFVVCNYDPHGNIMALNDYTKFIPPIGGLNSTLEAAITNNQTLEDRLTNNATIIDIDDVFEKIKTIIESYHGDTKNETAADLEKKHTDNETLLGPQEDIINNTKLKNDILEKIHTLLNGIFQ